MKIGVFRSVLQKTLQNEKMSQMTSASYVFGYLLWLSLSSEYIYMNWNICNNHLNSSFEMNLFKTIRYGTHYLSLVLRTFLYENIFYELISVFLIIYKYSLKLGVL